MPEEIKLPQQRILQKRGKDKTGKVELSSSLKGYSKTQLTASFCFPNLPLR